MKIDHFITAIILLVVFYVLFYIGKRFHDLLHREYDLTEELVEKDNPAIALAVVGYYLGMVFAIGGTLVGPSTGIVDDILDLCIYGALSIVLLNISWFICDKIMLYRFKIVDELIRDRNQGTGVVSCGVSIASGIIIFGSVSGEGGTIWTATGFWALGQIILILAVFLYTWITPYNVHDEIEKDNVAAGVSLAGAIVAMGIIIGMSAEGNFESWSEALPDFFLVSFMGLLLLPVVRYLTDKVLLPTVTLADEIANQETPNLGAAYIEAFSYIAASLVISWCV
ncbi:MAG: DUF350 domain-containing protein [Desulfobacterium sp.]|nr:DUF350 domain-containing protein [Desulfobacterium sp.]